MTLNDLEWRNSHVVCVISQNLVPGGFCGLLCKSDWR